MQKLPQSTARETLNLVNNEGAGLREGTAKASARHSAGNPSTGGLASAKAPQKFPQGTPRGTFNLVNNEGAGLREGTAKASARHPAGNLQPGQQRGRWPPRRHRKSFRNAPRGEPSTLSTTKALASAKAPQKLPQGTPRGTLNLVNNEGAGLREGTAKASARHTAGNLHPGQQRKRRPPRRAPQQLQQRHRRAGHSLNHKPCQQRKPIHLVSNDCGAPPKRGAQSCDDKVPLARGLGGRQP